MKLVVDTALAAPGLSAPDLDRFERWAGAALAGRVPERAREAALSVRIVDEAESAELNGQYRGRPHPTNVLSFPMDAWEGAETWLPGDLVLCAPVVEREAVEQGKALEAHWAHLVVHGVLHLLGYDHETADEAAVMEALETRLLNALGFPDPYGEWNGQ